MILNLDLGNSRLKWQLEISGKAGCVQHLAYTDVEKLKSMWDFKSLKKVRIASVGNSTAYNFLIHLCKTYAVEILEFKTSKEFDGIKNAYGDNYKNLGIDRWLNIIASYKEFGAVFVVSAGSALTLDKINSKGEHQGGFIVPGLQLSLDSLRNKANFLNKINFSKLEEDQFYGKNTNDCVSLGIKNMQQSLLYSAYREENLPFILTGGDAQTIAKNLNLPHKIIEDLIFRGMRLVDK